MLIRKIDNIEKVIIMLIFRDDLISVMRVRLLHDAKIMAPLQPPDTQLSGFPSFNAAVPLIYYPSTFLPTPERSCHNTR
jgi:hypothetical protein